MDRLHKIHDLEITPPPELWGRIVEELDARGLYNTVSKKLQNYEIAPPPFLWDRIDKQLTEETIFSTVAKKLQAATVTPPAMAWQHIEQRLQETASTPKLAPLKPAHTRWKRYLVAASVIGLAGILAYSFFANGPKNKEPFSQVLVKNEPIPAPLSTPATTDTPEAPTPATANSAPEIAYGTGIASVSRSDLYPASKKPTQIRTASGNVYATTLERNKDIQGRYIMLMTEDGAVVRMSKKLGNMADCIAGDAPGAECTHKIAAWREELASSLLASTPDNFLDILELANKENGL